MRLTKIVAILVGIIVLLGLGFSLAMNAQAKPTIWGLIGAPKIASTENLVEKSSDVSYPWKAYSGDTAIGLLPCGDLTPDQPEDERYGEWCSDDGKVKLTRTKESTVLNYDGTNFAYGCSAGSSLPGALPECSIDPWGSFFR